jgi:hypothetical protein
MSATGSGGGDEQRQSSICVKIVTERKYVFKIGPAFSFGAIVEEYDGCNDLKYGGRERSQKRVRNVSG